MFGAGLGDVAREERPRGFAACSARVMTTLPVEAAHADLLLAVGAYVAAQCCRGAPQFGQSSVRERAGGRLLARKLRSTVEPIDDVEALRGFR